MDKGTLEKLAKLLIEKEYSEKTAEMDKVAELQASYDLGQYTADAFLSEFNKIAQLANQADEAEKVAAVYEDYGRSMAREYYASLIKNAVAADAAKAVEMVDDKNEKEEEEKEEDKEPKKEEASEKKASARDRLIGALRQLKK